MLAHPMSTAASAEGIEDKGVRLGTCHVDESHVVPSDIEPGM